MANDNIHWPKMRNIVKSEDFERFDWELWYKLYDMIKNGKMGKMIKYAGFVKGWMTNDIHWPKNEENFEIGVFWKSQWRITV